MNIFWKWSILYSITWSPCYLTSCYSSKGDIGQFSGQGRGTVPPGLHMLPILHVTGSQGDIGQSSGQGRQDTEGGSCAINKRQVHKRSYTQRGSFYPQGTIHLGSKKQTMLALLCFITLTHGVLCTPPPHCGFCPLLKKSPDDPYLELLYPSHNTFRTPSTKIILIFFL